MLKKFSFLLYALVLFGCRSGGVSSWGGINDYNLDISEVGFSEQKNFNVGVLLPLSGSAAKYGQGLKNATMMALEDVKNHNLTLQFYDTKSTPGGARVAVENALNNGSRLIIGPLMSSSVKAISDQTLSRGVPVIAFSTAEEVLQPEVYSLGLLIDEQVDRIMTYAALQGRKSFALVIPDNSTGISVAKSAVKAAKKNHVKIVKIAFYPPNTTDFSSALKPMTNYTSRKASADNIKAGLKKRIAAGDEAARRELKKMERYDSVGGVDFDAVLIPESGPRLKSAIAMFGYYDIFSPDVKFLGTSVWETTSLNRETVAIGSWYTAMSKSHSEYFGRKYAEIFGEKPSSLYSLAYDAVALSVAISKQPSRNINQAITNPDGYIGINGAFRLFPNGKNEHSLDIFEVTKTGDVVIDSAPRKFESHGYEDSTGYYEETFERPQIFGKDSSIAQGLIFGSIAKTEPQNINFFLEN